VGSPDGGSGGFRQAEVADLSGLDEFADRAGDLFDRHVRVNAVLVEQVDCLCAKPRERCVGYPLDLFGAAVESGRLAVLYSPPELSGQHHLVPDGGQGLAHEILVEVGPVDLGGIEKCDSQVDGAAQDGDHRVPVARVRPVALRHAHAAEPDG
jgi:hypothetical protein